MRSGVGWGAALQRADAGLAPRHRRAGRWQRRLQLEIARHRGARRAPRRDRRGDGERCGRERPEAEPGGVRHVGAGRRVGHSVGPSAARGNPCRSVATAYARRTGTRTRPAWRTAAGCSRSRCRLRARRARPTGAAEVSSSARRAQPRSSMALAGAASGRPSVSTRRRWPTARRAKRSRPTPSRRLRRRCA